MRSRCAGFILKHNFAFTFTRIPVIRLWRNRHTFAGRTADVQWHFHTGVYSRLWHELCVTGYTSIFPGLQFHGAFFTSIRRRTLSWFHYNFRGFKADLAKHGKAIQWEVGVIKLTAKPASVLANKPQLRGENRYMT